MTTIEICIGSSCYVKGSNQVVKIVSDIINENNWQDKVEVKGSFCMKACQRKIGLGIRINDKQLEGVNLDNAKEVITKELQAVI